MTDLEYPPQKKRHAKVSLLDTKGRLLRRGRMEIREGEPLGDWVEFRGIRIALRRVKNDFEGIVPDSTE